MTKTDTQTLLDFAGTLDWQDIASAPRDGTRILGKHKNLIVGIRWAKRNYSGAEGWRGFSGNVEPTEWTQIPTGNAGAVIRELVDIINYNVSTIKKLAENVNAGNVCDTAFPIMISINEKALAKAAALVKGEKHE